MMMENPPHGTASERRVVDTYRLEGAALAPDNQDRGLILVAGPDADTVIGTYEPVPEITTVNYHVVEPCNMKCTFCFATFQDVRTSILPKGHLGVEAAKVVVGKLVDPAGRLYGNAASTEEDRCEGYEYSSRSLVDAEVADMLAEITTRPQAFEDRDGGYNIRRFRDRFQEKAGQVRPPREDLEGYVQMLVRSFYYEPRLPPKFENVPAADWPRFAVYAPLFGPAKRKIFYELESIARWQSGLGVEDIIFTVMDSYQRDIIELQRAIDRSSLWRRISTCIMKKLRGKDSLAILIEECRKSQTDPTDSGT